MGISWQCRIWSALAWVAASMPIIAARAEEPPSIVALKQDVKIEYKFSSTVAGSQDPSGGTQTWYFKAGGDLQRFDMAVADVYMVSNLRSQRSFVVLPSIRSYWEPPTIDPPGSFKVSGPERWKKGQKETIAGRECSVWSVEIKGAAYASCVTDDGLTLRQEGPEVLENRGRSVMEATSVTYGTLPESLFQVPKGYRKSEGPAIPHFIPGGPLEQRSRP